MIETLRIRNFAIVESEELEFGPGLNVLTGETGAGKSIVLGALALLAGARAASDRIGAGDGDASVEAVFRTASLPALEAALGERGFPTEDHSLCVGRIVQPSGRSRARLNGELVPAGLLAELFAGHIEISSQHDSQSLLRPEVHARLLDRAGGLLELRDAIAAGCAELRALDAELRALCEAERDRERQRDFLVFQIREIDDAQLGPEISSLRGERTRLAHAERLREGSALALAALTGDLADGEGGNAGDLLAEASHQLEALAALDPDLEVLRGRVAALAEEARDAAADLERYGASLEAEPARLAALDERLAQVEALQRKYGGSVEEVLRFRDEAARELEALEGASDRAREIEQTRVALCDRLESQAAKLSKGRARAGRRLGRDVEKQLRELAMPKARFQVALMPAPLAEGAPTGPGGREVVDFRFAAGGEGEPRPLRRVASGGELSRTLLAIKSALRDGSGMVLVFDEVDAGIGGGAADRVGRCLAELAVSHQVLCITHLPQIAAYASTHLRVSKRDDAEVGVARIERIEGAERVEEIARMAGGEKVGEATRKHAQALLREHAPPPTPR